MSFLFRSLCAVIGAAFLFALANLAVSGLPERGTGVELASDTPPPSPGAPSLGALSPDTLRDVAVSLLGMASSQPPPAVALPSDPPASTPIVAAPAPSLAPLATALEAEWRGWMATNGLSEGAMTVRLPDGTTHHAGLERTADAPAPVASLSKAITGLCMDIVLQEQGLGWDTTLEQITAQMSAVRVTPQAWNAHVTLASLATHTSGLSPDITQGTMGDQRHGALGLHRRIASEALRPENMQGTQGRYVYNNTNYAVLGVVIEALTGQSYSEACMARVIAPAGVTDATIHGRMGARSSFGGWEMSTDSYARLAQYWFSDGGGYVEQPSDRPLHNGYALGYFIDGLGAEAHVSHAGYYCYGGQTGTGAYVHARGDGVVFSANWAGRCVSANATGFGALIAGHM